MGITRTLFGLLVNPRGWEIVRTVSNDMVTDGGQTLVGTLTFILQRSRGGRRRYLVRNPDRLHESTVRHSIGRSHGELWVREGRLPIIPE